MISKPETGKTTSAEDEDGGKAPYSSCGGTETSTDDVVS
jgi:hypothetical protein